MINYQVSASLLRYIVPFTYEGDFDVTCAKIDREGADSVIPGRPSDRGWIRYTPSMVSGESDLYAYIREEFMFDDPEGAQPRRGGSQRGGEAAAQGSALPGVSRALTALHIGNPAPKQEHLLFLSERKTVFLL